MTRASLLALLFLLAPGCEHGHEHPHAEGEGDAGGGHAHEAPHGGTLVVLGEEAAHVELLLDAESGALEAWVLDGSAERGVRLSQPAITLRVLDEPAFEVRLDAVASSLSGETVGDTSAFRGEDERLRGRTEFEAELGELVVRGVPFEGVSFGYPEGNEAHEGDHDGDH